MTTEGGSNMPFSKKDFVKAKVHQPVSPGEALKIIRELQELSQNELANLTGISQSNISAMESGTRQMGRERALVLAKALHVHPAVLLFPDFNIEDVA
jgi:transcriptional regulator with XRE-family HTH domain